MYICVCVPINIYIYMRAYMNVCKNNIYTYTLMCLSDVVFLYTKSLLNIN